MKVLCHFIICSVLTLYTLLLFYDESSMPQFTASFVILLGSSFTSYYVLFCLHPVGSLRDVAFMEIVNNSVTLDQPSSLIPPT